MRLINADKLMEELNKLIGSEDQRSYCLEHECTIDDNCTDCYIKAAIELVQSQPAFSEDFTEDLLTMGFTKGYKKGYIQALADIIIKAEDERDTIYNWEEDEYENGMRAAYQDIIEILEDWKEQETNGDSNSGNS